MPYNIDKIKITNTNYGRLKVIKMMMMSYEEVVALAVAQGYYPEEVMVVEEDDCLVVGFGEEYDYQEWCFHSLEEVSYDYQHVVGEED